MDDFQNTDDSQETNDLQEMDNLQSSDIITQTTTYSWFDNMKGALSAMLYSPLIIIGAICLLVWNEHRSVEQYKNLLEMHKDVISISANHILPENEGKLVHLIGSTTTQYTLVDPVFNVSEKAIKMKRVVKMFQWNEKIHQNTIQLSNGSKINTTTYTYYKVWSENPINSSYFHENHIHINPQNWEYNSQEFPASNVQLEAFTLSQSQINKIDNYVPLRIRSSILPVSFKNMALYKGGYYKGKNPEMPEIGDISITFLAAYPSKISLIAKQYNTSFMPYETHNGEINIIKMGEYSSEEIFRMEMRTNTQETWFLRLVGFTLMLVGFTSLCGPLKILADFVPVLNVLVDIGLKIVTFCLSLSLSIITIAISWLAYHPLISGVLLVTGLSLPFVMKLLHQSGYLPSHSKKTTILKSG